MSKDPSELLATYMLQGWSMTAEHCTSQDHSVPKVKRRGGNETFCVVCDAHALGGSPGTQITTTPRESKTEKHTTTPDAKKAQPSLSTRSDDMEARRNLSSTLIGQHLLQGWVLLAESCDKPECYYTPMMNDHQGMPICVLCQHDKEASMRDPSPLPKDKVGGDHPVSTPALPPALKGNPTSSQDEQEMEQRRIQKDMCTARIGQHLLKGWTLLDTLCPNDTCHGIPLIREPNGKECICVVCSGRYLREADMTKEERAKAREDAAKSSSQPQKDEASPGDQAALSKNSVQEKNSCTPSPPPPPSPPFPPHQHDLKREDSTFASRQHLIPSKTLQVLSRQMVRMTEQLDQVSSVASPEDVIRRAQAIEACARAMSACQSMM